MYRALVVDDEKWSLFGICKTFRWQNYGFQLINGVQSAKAALDIITSEKPDVVFSDIRMPGMTGLELIDRAKDTSPGTEFVIISGFSEFDYAQRAIRQKVFDYCLKPISQQQADDLLERLRTHLDAKAQRAARQSAQEEQSSTGFKAMLAYIQDNLNTPMTLKELSVKFYVTPNHCSYLFQTQLNTTYSDYITGLRMERARQLLSETDKFVYEIADEVGYDDPQYFNRVFRLNENCTPLEFRRSRRAKATGGEA